MEKNNKETIEKYSQNCPNDWIEDTYRYFTFTSFVQVFTSQTPSLITMEIGILLLMIRLMIFP